MAIIHWNSGVDGDWGTAADWKGGAVPGAGDTVIIDPTGTYTVTISTAEAAKSLTLNDAGATVADSSTLTMGGALALTEGTFQLNSGGVISGGTLSATGGAFAWAGGELSGVTYDGTVDLSPAFSLLFVKGLTAMGAGGTGAGTINVAGQQSIFAVYGGETLDNATVNLSGALSTFDLYNPGDLTPVLTLGSHLNVVVGANTGVIGDYFTGFADNSIVNDGTITAGVSGGNLGFDLPGHLSNNGTIAVSNGASLHIGAYGYNLNFTNAATGVVSITGAGTSAQIGSNAGSWSNAGTISVSSGATLTLEDTFTTAQLTKIVDSAGTIALYGILTNTGATLTVGTGTADPIVKLDGGYRGFGDIVGGTIVDKGSGMVFNGGTLSGVTFDGTMNISSVFVNGGLTLHGVNGTGAGTINLEGDVDLYADGGETLTNATLNIGFGSYGGGALKLFDPSHANPVLTLGSSFDIVHAGGFAELLPNFTDANGAIVNNGTITAGAAGGTFIVQGGSFTNNGSIAVSNGDTFNLNAGTFVEGAAGTISVASGSTLNLGVALTTAQLGKIANSGTIGIGGVLTNTGATLKVGAGTSEPTVALDSGGVILGGTIVDEGSGMVLNGGTLSGVTFEGTLTVGYQERVFVTGGLMQTGVGGTGPGVINVSGFEGQFHANGGETLDNATVNIGAIDSLGIDNVNDANPVLTFGSHLSIVQISNGGGITDYSGFGDDTIVNDGTITAASGIGGGFSINPVNFTNNGFLVVGAGEVLDLQPGTLTNLSGTTLTGGSYEADGASGFELNQNVAIATLDATVILNGAGSTIESFNNTTSAEVAIDSTLTTIGKAGTLEILGSRNWTSTLAMSNAGTLDLGGGTFTAPSLSNTGLVSGFGVMATKLTNSGSLTVTGGQTLSLVGGSLTNLSAGTLTGGTYTVGAGGILQLANNVTITTLRATVDLAGSGATVQSLNTTTSKEVSLASSLNTIGVTGVLDILGGASFKSANTIASAGSIVLGGATLTAAALTNTGSIIGSGTITAVLTNSGALSVSANKTLSLVGGSLTNLSGTTLTGGKYTVGAGATLQLANNTSIATLNATVDLAGVGSVVQGLNTGTSTEVTLGSSLTAIGASGTLQILGGGGFTTANAVGNSGTIQLGGGTLAGGTLTDAAGSVLTGFGTVSSTFSDSGTTTSLGGTLAFSGKGDVFSTALTGTEIDFAGGTDLLQSGSSLTAATVGVSGAAVVTLGASHSFAGKLTQASGTTLALGANTLTLTGTGSTFAGTVSGTGTLAFTGGTQAINTGASLTVSNWSLTGGTTTIAETLTYKGAFTEGAGATLTLTAGDKLTLTGATSLSGLVHGASRLTVSSATLSGFTIGGTVIFEDSVSVNQTGTVTVGDKTTSAATLTVDAGATYTIAGGGGIGRGSATTSAINENGTLTNSEAGVSVVAVKVVDTGSLVAAVGTLDFTKGLSGTGTMSVNSGAILEADLTVASSLSMTFNGGNAILALKTPSGFAATINGFAPTDTIDLLGKKATSATLGTGDTLVIKNGTTTIATLQLAGTYTGDTFNVASDGNGGTNVTVTTGAAATPPPAAPVVVPRPVLPFVAAMAGLGAAGGAGHASGAVHAEAWRPTLTAPRMSAFA